MESDFEFKIKLLKMAGVEVPNDLTKENFSEKISPQLEYAAYLIGCVREKYSGDDPALFFVHLMSIVFLEGTKNGTIDLLDYTKNPF
jgi:hypothetical protein